MIFKFLHQIFYGKKASISVCILFYNKIDQTIECIESFTPSRIPIYVLNNASTPENRESLEILNKKYKQLTIIDSEINLGVSKGRNRLIRETTEDWLFFVDNDIVVKQKYTWPYRFLLAMKSEVDADAYMPLLFNKHENRIVDHRYLAIENGYTVVIDPPQQYTNIFPGGASIISRDYFNKIGLYAEEMFVGYEDFEMTLRALRKRQLVKAVKWHSVFLVHDHRYSSNVEDAESAAVRYSENKISISEKYVADTYNVKFHGDWRGWAREQESLLTREQK